MSERPFPQLPVHWYFDQKVHDAEVELLFKNGPQYVGHQLMVPDLNDFYTLEWMGHAQMLVHNEAGIELISNVCRHRQALMQMGRGNRPNILCPIHRWSYDNQGRLKGAPHFPENPCLHLDRSSLQNWKGLLFQGPRDVARDLAQLGFNLDFSGYMLDEVVIDDLECNWKAFMETYMDDYHVVPFHPGLGRFVNCDNLTWEFGDWYNVQTVGVSNKWEWPGTQTYAEYHEALLKYQGGELPERGAIWMTYYPNVMIECYPHMLIISTVIPRGVGRTTNVAEFYFPAEILRDRPEFAQASKAAYLETALEDKEICERMQAGRRALYEQGRSEVGPYQSPMEDGMEHFHRFLREQLDRHLR